MTKQELLALAQKEGFFAAMLPPEQIPVDPKFRTFCEENLCGKYGANYSCPPDCGSPEALHESILAEKYTLIVETVWDIAGYEDKAAVQHAKMTHNAAVLRLHKRLTDAGYAGFCSGYNGCPLCSPCKRVNDQPCAHPESRISCLSAYCVDVAELARRCKLEFAWKRDKLYLFGMIAFHEK